MTRIEFKNLPNKTTPITAENLDKLNNLAIDTSVGEHEEEVVLVKTKNLFNGIYEVGTINTSTGGISSSSATYTTDYIKIEKDKTYTFSFDYSTLANTNVRDYRFYDTNKTYLNIGANYNPSTKKLTFTPTQNGYVRIAFDKNCINLQLEEGTTATTYDSWKATEIYANKEKYTDTLNIGVEPNNSGLWVEYENLHNQSTLLRGYEIQSSNGSATANSEYYVSDYIPITPNTNVYVSGKTSGSSYCFYNSSKTFISTVSLSGGVGTLTTPNNTNVAYMRYNGRLTELNNNIVVSTKPTPSIKVNNNGVYETIVNKNVYSTGEVVIGEWLGKPLYRKVVSLGTLPNATGKRVAHNISNIDIIANVRGISVVNSWAAFVPLPLSVVDNVTGNVQIVANKTEVIINTGNNKSTWTENYAILEYTKTTD